MNAKGNPAEAAAINLETENDRFKRSFGSWFWGSMIAATVLHFVLFQFWPTQTAADLSFTAEELELIEIPPEIEIPPPPEAISRPATPVMAVGDIDHDITIAPTTFADNPVDVLPPPPTNEGEADLSAAPVFTPMTVRPEIRNRREVEAALLREYPAILRNAGIGGTVVLWLYLSDEGVVLDRRLSRSSGQAQLDQAALRVAGVFQFTPAMNRTELVAVWIEVPITFQAL